MPLAGPDGPGAPPAATSDAPGVSDEGRRIVTGNFWRVPWPEELPPPTITPGMVKEPSGPYRSLQPTEKDQEVRDYANHVAHWARFSEYPLAASLMRHYLGKSGEPYEIDMSQLRNDNDAVESRLAAAEEAMRTKMLLWAKERFRPGHELNGTFPGTGWRYQSGGLNDNWTNALGAFSVAVVGNIEVSAQGVVTMNVATHVFDHYDWTMGSVLGKQIPEQKVLGFTIVDKGVIRDGEMSRLSAVGYARDFAVYGTQIDRRQFPISP